MVRDEEIGRSSVLVLIHACDMLWKLLRRVIGFCVCELGREFGHAICMQSLISPPVSVKIVLPYLDLKRANFSSRRRNVHVPGPRSGVRGAVGSCSNPPRTQHRSVEDNRSGCTKALPKQGKKEMFQLNEHEGDILT